MELAGTTVVVTGAASGIGRALARRFAAEGARVVVADVDGAGVAQVAAEIDGLPFVCDAAAGAEVEELIATAERSLGPIDLFAANAGVGGGYDLDTPDAGWDLALAVNVRAHVEAARRMVPRWVERGGGYFLSTASAAGLLTAIGSAPYTVSKTAAVAFAEWLSITYGDRGVKVSCVCPMGVDTPLLRGGMPPAMSGRDRLGSEVIVASSRLLQPEEVAESVVAGLAAERFLILPHPEVDKYVQLKAADRDAWLEGMRRLQAYHLGRLEEMA